MWRGGYASLSGKLGVLNSWLTNLESMAAEAPCQVSSQTNYLCGLRLHSPVKERFSNEKDEHSPQNLRLKWSSFMKAESPEKILLVNMI